MATTLEFKSSAQSRCTVPSSKPKPKPKPKLKPKQKEKPNRRSAGFVEGRSTLTESNYLSSTVSSSGKNKNKMTMTTTTMMTLVHKNKNEMMTPVHKNENNMTMTTAMMTPVDATADFLHHRSRLHGKSAKTKDAFSTDLSASPQSAPCFPQKQFQASFNENFLEDSGKRSREDGSDSADHKKDSYSSFLLPARRHNLEGQGYLNRLPTRTNKKACTDDLEIQVEEKIIKPVFTERKSDGKCLLKQSSDPLDGDVTKKTPDYDGVINELTQTCQDYAAKLYESKNNVQSLRSELALEKHQRLEMVKLVKELELLPSQAPIRGTNKTLLLGILEDVEATRKEEVIETEFLCRVCSGPEPVVTLILPRENGCAPMQPALRRRKSQTHEISEVALPLKASSNIVLLDSQLSRDGIHLPWLQFDDETDVDIGFQLPTDFRDDLRKQEACSGNNKYVHNIARRPLRMRLAGFSNLDPPQNWPCNIRIGHALGAYSLKKDWARWRQSFVEACYGYGYEKDYEREPTTFGNIALTKILVLPFPDNHTESGVFLLCIGTLGSVQCRALASENKHNLKTALEENISVGKYLSYPTTNYDDEQAFLKACLEQSAFCVSTTF